MNTHFAQWISEREGDAAEIVSYECENAATHAGSRICREKSNSALSLPATYDDYDNGTDRVRE